MLREAYNKCKAALNWVVKKVTPTVNAIVNSFSSLWDAARNFASGTGNTLIAAAEGLQMVPHGVKASYLTAKTTVYDTAQIAYGFACQDAKVMDEGTQQLRQDFDHAVTEWKAWAEHGASALSHGYTATADSLNGLVDTGSSVLYGLQAVKEVATLGIEGASFCAEQASNAATDYVGSQIADISFEEGEPSRQRPGRLALAAAAAA